MPPQQFIVCGYVAPECGTGYHMADAHYSIGATRERYWHGLVGGDVNDPSPSPPRRGEGSQSGKTSAQLLCYTYVALLVRFHIYNQA